MKGSERDASAVVLRVFLKILKRPLIDECIKTRVFNTKFETILEI